jgi:cytochrome b
MKFARIVFTVAGIWGIVVLMPLYWLFDVTGRQYSPPTDYPHFFYGFVSVALAWQIAFLVIGSNPARFRPFMIPAILEKLGYVTTLAVSYAQARISATDTQPILPDLVLGLFFIAAFVKTRAPGEGRVSALRPSSS